jgi:predicted AAA+ superfamily ATPase
MAVTNRDRIGQMLEILAPELDSFIQRTVQPELPPGEDWTYIAETRDQVRGKGAVRTYSRSDPQLQLRMLSENITGQYKTGWYPFDRLLSRSHKAMAAELADCRNKWAHNDPFNTDDATRALDTAERLLTALNSAAAANKVQKIRVDLRRVAVDRDDQRVVKKAVLDAVAPGLRPWREVLAPHDDVATGNFRAAEFAADLFKVATRSSDTSRDYSDPVEFFSRTYLTEGLQNLIGGAIDRLRGDPNASPVVNLQTNFGGGKTHSMLALWHLAGRQPISDFPQDVQDLLNAHRYQDIPADVKRVAIVGNHFAASGEDRGDLHVNTVWGELAWQLGGKEGYDLVREADETSTAPGEALHELLEYFAPAVILIDEWVAYARQLVGREDLAGGTFETQFTFAQAVTETVKAIPGMLLAISIPASHDSDVPDVDAIGSAEEVGGENGRLALSRLQNVVRRVADQWRPASADESYQIVRQRLFIEPNAEQLALIAETARSFGDMYRKHSADFPRASLEKPYEDRIKRSYPIHPELFDRLYGEWSTLERFQRTRGVLRLMNTVIHALWTGGDSAPLIMSGSIPLNVAEVNAELTQYLTDSWKAVIDADVAGLQSTPARIDNARTVFGQRSLTQRLARTVFFGAVPTLGSAHKGLETARVFLGTAMPGDVIGNYHSALTALSDTATYFYSSAGRYWYDLQANISRTAKDHAERLHAEDVWAEIEERLSATERKNIGAFAAVQVAPAETGDIPDVDQVRLIIVHPKAGYSRREGIESPAARFAQAATEKRGTANRIHRNMLVFLAADSDRLAEVDTAVRTYLGWKSVVERERELSLTSQQIEQARDRQDRASTTVDDRIVGAYHWIVAPEWPPTAQSFTLTATKAEGAATSLAERVSKRMIADSTLNIERAATLIRLDIGNHLSTLWQEHGHISVEELWGYYADYPYMPRLRDRDVLDAGIRGFAQGHMYWQQESFATADDVDQSGRYVGLLLPTDDRPVTVRNTTLLVRPDLAEQQRAEEKLSQEPVAGTAAAEERTGSGGGLRVEPAAPLVVYTRFYGSDVLSPERYAGDFAKIINEILQPLAGVDGTELEVRVDIKAVNPTGFDEAKRRIVNENAATLRFEQHGFEEL